VNSQVSVNVSVIIPAWNEAAFISSTLSGISLVKEMEKSRWNMEVIVVDDGSSDDTVSHAMPWADEIIRHPRNFGKGASLMSGVRKAKGELLVFLDADLGDSAMHMSRLLEPLAAGTADMVVAKLPSPERKGGIGLVRTLAGAGVYRLSGYRPLAPLSGQRSIRAEAMKRIGRFAGGFGVEVGLTIDAVRLGYRVCELEIPFSHRESGRDLRGWLHRGRQFCSVGCALWERWWRPIC
jgi:glycosyltransferase involved in cell wall biosynthesis